MNTYPSLSDTNRRQTHSGLGDRLPEPSLFYSSPAHEELLARIRKVAESNGDIVLLTGAQGAGKTTLIYQLQSGIPNHWLLCRVDCDPMMHPDQLLNRLARCVGAQPANLGMAEAIGQALSGLRLKGYLPVILLDDAEQLPISSLITLIRLHEQRVDSTPVCALVLLAHSSIVQTLTTHQLRAMGTSHLVRLEMPVLTTEQTGDYIRHFLRVEGVESDLELDAEQLAGIHGESRGLPGNVNDLVIRALRKPVDHKRVSLGRLIRRRIHRIPPLTAKAVAVVASLLVLSILFESQLDHLFQLSEPVEHRTENSATTEVSAALTDPLIDSDPAHKPLATLPLPLPLPDVNRQSAEPVQTRPLGVVNKQETLPIAAAPKSDLPDTAKQPAPTPPTQSGRPVWERTDATELVPKPGAPANDSRYPKRTAWLLKQDPHSYSLQILAAGSEAAVQRFLQQHGLDRDLYYFESRRNGLPWFTVLHGIYTDRGSAVAALNALPESLRTSGAWPRSFGSIHKEIRQVR